MRPAARLKLGYYPLPVEQGPMLRSRLSFPETATSAVDPCCGTGAALQALTAGSQSTLYGVELDADRAISAEANGLKTIHGNVFDVRARVERLSFLYLNPPYDFEVGPLANERMEKLFLAHTYNWLRLKGILLMVIPCKAVFDIIDTLTTRFNEIHIYRLGGAAAEQYDQCAVFAVRHNNNGNDARSLHHQVYRLMSYPKSLPVLAPEVDRMYSVPPTAVVEIYTVGLPLDEIEDRMTTSNAWKAAVPLLLPKQEVAGGSPITPLHGGHVGLLATAGMLNGVFGEGDRRHLARWRPVKHTMTTTEIEGETEVTRVKERFSNELAVVFGSGQTLILTETKKEDLDSGVTETVSVASDEGHASDNEDGVKFSKVEANDLFDLGRLVMTRSVQLLVVDEGFNPQTIISRHMVGDWGDLSPQDLRSNDEAVKHGEDRIFSSYDVPCSPDGKMWIITEADRSVTTVLLPSDY